MRGRRSARTASATGAPGSRRAVTVGEPSGAGSPRVAPWTASPTASSTAPTRPPTPTSTPLPAWSPTSTTGPSTRVGALYDELGVGGDVLDLMSSWVSHLRTPPRSLTVLGLNAVELAANPMATARVVHDLNADPRLPFADASFDAVVNCVSVDYLRRAGRGARRGRPGAAARRAVGLHLLQPLLPDQGRPRLAVGAGGRSGPAIVAAYHRAAGGFDEPTTEQRLVATWRHDPLWAVWARRGPDPVRSEQTATARRGVRALRATGGVRHGDEQCDAQGADRRSVMGDLLDTGTTATVIRPARAAQRSGALDGARCTRSPGRSPACRPCGSAQPSTSAPRARARQDGLREVEVDLAPVDARRRRTRRGGRRAGRRRAAARRAAARGVRSAPDRSQPDRSASVRSASASDSAGQAHAAQVRAAQRHPGPVAALDGQRPERRAHERRAGELAAAQDRAEQPRALHPAAEERAGVEHRRGELGAGQVAVLEHDAAQLGLAEVGAHEALAREGAALEHLAGEVLHGRLSGRSGACR